MRNLSTGETTNLRIADSYFDASGDWLVVLVYERHQVEDLNGDGDTWDQVLHVHNLATGETTNLRLVLGSVPARWVVSGDWLVVWVSESGHGQAEDLNGDGDTRDEVLHLVDLAAIGALPRFLRGDCNGDGQATGQVTDAVFLLRHNFGGGEGPPCLAACDANGDGRVEVTDAVYMLMHNFGGGPTPVLPFPRCARSVLATDAELGCQTPHSCQ